MAGSNDILLDIPLKETKVAMETIGAMLAPWNKTVYIGIPPVTKEESALFGWQRVSDVARHNEELRLYGTWLVTWSCQKGFRIIDFLKALDIGTGNVYEDGVHPNEQGYALFAQAFWRLLKQRCVQNRIDWSRNTRLLSIVWMIQERQQRGYRPCCRSLCRVTWMWYTKII